MMSDAGMRPVSMNRPRGAAAGAVVRAQPVTETSLMESVAGFITEVQAFQQLATGTTTTPGGGLSGGPGSHGGHDSGKPPQVTWARFETVDLNDRTLYPESMEINGNNPPLLLILGYTIGVQVWLIPANGEAQEIVAQKHGQIKTLKLLRTPDFNSSYGSPDNFAHCRPLMVTVDSTGPGAPFSSATFTSMKSGEIVQNIQFNSEIADVLANRRIVVIAFREKLAAFDACNLEARFTVTNCYPSPGVHANPIALGDRWLAYADQRLVGIHRSQGGMETDGNQSVAAWGINVGSKLAQGVSKIYSNFFSSSSTSSSSQPLSSPSANTGRHSHFPSNSSGVSAGGSNTSGPLSGNEVAQKGVVTVLDIIRAYRPDHEEVNLMDRMDGVIAHFIAHNKAVVAMSFDANGSLLLTCDRLGSYFNLFRIVPHPAGSCYSAVHHLYSLYRGDTPGSVQDIAFSPDSRWVAVSTLRGTTHIFPITPYGGPVGVRTHTSSRVVNRLSRFHRSAGLDECRQIGSGGVAGSVGSNAGSMAGSAPAGSGRSSPNPLLGSSPVFSKMYVDQPGLPIVMAFPNPHVPPFATPTLVQPLAQLRQPYLVTITGQTLGVAAAATSHASGSRKSSKGSKDSLPNVEDTPIRLAVTFAPSRARIMGSQNNYIFNRQPRRMSDCLYVMANHGVLLEYALDPIPDSTLPKDKICESSPIELQISPYGQWTMTPPRDRAELQPPLFADNPLMLPLEQLLLRGSSSSSTCSNSRIRTNRTDQTRNQAAIEAGEVWNNQSANIGGSGGEESDKWLSQVEIVTHVGPHRRLWMGPQFCFKTFKPAKDGTKMEELAEALDIDAEGSRPEQSNPVNMPTSLRHGSVPVLIEAGSASSFELSPRFAANRREMHERGSREHILDVESELQEAMSETVDTEEHNSLLDGSRKSSTMKNTHMRGHAKFRHGNVQSGTQLRMDSGSTPEEEFFCLTPEDSRSIISTASGGSSRSRNASSTSTTSAIAGRKSIDMKSNNTLPVQMGLPDTKIFSVAVEAKPAEKTGTDAMVICDVDTDYTGRFAVVSSCYPNKPSVSDYQRKEAVDRDNKKRVSEMKTKNRSTSDTKKKDFLQDKDETTPSNTSDLLSLRITAKEGLNENKMISSSSTQQKKLEEEMSQKMISIEVAFPEKEDSPVVTESVRGTKSCSSKNEPSKSGKKGKKKKKGGCNTITKVDSVSSFDSSANAASSVDTDTPIDNSSSFMETKNPSNNVFKNKKNDISTKEKDSLNANDNDDLISTDLEENETKYNETQKDTKSIQDATELEEKNEKNEGEDEDIVDITETLSSAFATSPNENIELLKDGSQQSYENMSTEELLAEALLSTTNDATNKDCGDKAISDDENFSSEFSKAVTIKDQNKCEDEEEDDLDEPFIIKERTPDSDDSSDENEGTSEKDKSAEETPPPVPLVDPDTSAHPLTTENTVNISNIQSSISMLMPSSANSKSSNLYDSLFPSEKPSIADNGSDIISKIKLAEKIYDNNTEDEEASEKKEEKKAAKSFASALSADLHLSAKGFLGENKKSSSKMSVSADTSEDDLEISFTPALSRKEKRKKKHAAAKSDLSRRASGASFADSESSLIDDDESTSLSKGTNPDGADASCKSNQEGWSFEADDLDVNRLIAEVVNDVTLKPASLTENSSTSQKEKDNAEEKTSLDEVFKFDSELAVAANAGSTNSEEDDNMEDVTSLNDKTNSSKNHWNNFNTEDETSEDDNAKNIISYSSKVKDSKMTKSLNVKVDSENNKIEKEASSDNDNNTSSSAFGSSKNQLNGKSNLSQSLVLGTTTEGTTSESSVGNSPNPRKTTKKSKKQRNKKKF